MVLKKPYAFIIKHFRVIHLALLIPIFYLIIKIKSLHTFFSNYVFNDYSFSFTNILTDLSSSYVNIFMYLAVVIILIVLIFLFFLLQNKEKPTKFYSISIIYYIAIFILLATCSSMLNSIEDGTLSYLVARIARDIIFVFHYSQYIFVFMFIVRGIGFNIKKFNFESDLNNLEISSEDYEEFEFLVGKDTYKTKRTIRRFIRELGYYYQENKFIFTIIFIITFIVLGTIIFNSFENNKVYKENDSFAFGYINIKIKDSYVSDLSMNGKMINPNKTYVILELEMTNRYREDKIFNDANFRLLIKNKYISPNVVAANYFEDYGNPYNGSVIKWNPTANYLVVYEINKSELSNSYKIVAYSGFDTSEKNYGPKDKNITIKPTIVKSKITENNVNIGTELNFKNTNLKNTVASISGYEIMNRFTYKYNFCITTNNCYEASDAVSLPNSDIGRYTFLVLDYTLDLDESSKYINSNRNYKDFFEDFMEIKYKIGDKEYSSSVSVYNPKSYTDKLIIKVPININDADSINSIITVRDLSYNIKIK